MDVFLWNKGKNMINVTALPLCVKVVLAVSWVNQAPFLE